MQAVSLLLMAGITLINSRRISLTSAFAKKTKFHPLLNCPFVPPNHLCFEVSQLNNSFFDFNDELQGVKLKNRVRAFSTLWISGFRSLSNRFLKLYSNSVSARPNRSAFFLASQLVVTRRVCRIIDANRSIRTVLGWTKGSVNHSSKLSRLKTHLMTRGLRYKVRNKSEFLRSKKPKKFSDVDSRGVVSAGARFSLPPPPLKGKLDH